MFFNDFSFLNIIRIKIFYIDHVIEKVIYSVFYVYIFKFITHFQFILSVLISDLFNLVSWNRDKCFCFVQCFIRQQYILTAINKVMVIDKKVSKILKLCILRIIFFLLKLVSFTSITSSRIILSIMLAKCFPFSQLHVSKHVGFQT